MARLKLKQLNNVDATEGAVVIYDTVSGNIWSNNSTTALKVPKGPTADRPVSPDDGLIRFNTDIGTLESWSSTSSTWVAFGSGGVSDLSDVTGGQTELDTIPFAVPLTLATLKSDAIDKLNHVLGLLVPTAPSSFPGGQTLSITNVGTLPLLAAGSVPDNTSGGSLPASAGQTVTRVTASTVNTNTIGDNGISGYVGPGNSGTLTSVVNNTGAGSRALTSGVDDGTYGSLLISNDQAYPIATPGFYQSFRTSLVAASATQGWNRYQITHSAASNTNTVYIVRDNITATPVVASGVVTQNALGTTTNSSGVIHYASGASLRLASATITNLAGETYYNGNPINITSVSAFNSNSGVFVAQAFSYATSGITTPIARQTTTATAISNLTISLNSTNQHTAGNLVYAGTNVNGAGSGVTVTSPIVLLMNGTAQTTQVNEQVIVGTSTNAARTYLGSGATGDTPAVTLSSAAAWTSSQDLSVSGYLHEAVVSGGVIRQDTTNYSTGFLPANTVDYSTKNGTQYITLMFSKTALSNFSITITGTYAGMWIALPNISDNNTQSPNALGGVWWNAFQLYNGSGVPGRTGDVNAGCATGSIASGTSGTTNITFGTASSTNATGNRIFIRLKLTSGQRITALTLAN